MSKLSRNTGARVLWLAFGFVMGAPAVWDGIQRGLIGVALCGLALCILGVQGFLRPAAPSKMLTLKKEKMPAEIAIGSDALHGGLTLAMTAALLVGIVLKYMVKI